MWAKNLSTNSAMLIATIIWGSTFLVIKQSLVGVHAVTLVGYRFLLATLLMGGVLVFLRKNPWHSWRSGVILGLLLFVAYVTQAIALYYMQVVDVGFISGLFVVFVPILSFILGREKLRLQIIGAVVLAVIGLWSISGGVKSIGLGDFLILISALFFAGHIVYVDRVIKDSDLWVLNFQQFLVVTGASFVMVGLFKLPLVITDGKVIWLILYLALFANVLGYLLQLWAQHSISPTVCALILSLEPIVAAIFAWTIGGEEIIMRDVVGGAIILAAAVVAQVFRQEEIKS